MNEQALFVEANTMLTQVVNEVRPDQLDLVIPDELSWRPGVTLRSTLNLATYENKCVPEVLAGADDLASNDQFDGDLLGDDPGACNRYADIANQAATELDTPDRIVHMSYADASASDYLRDISINRSLAAFDIATFIGARIEMSDDLAQGLWDAAEPMTDLLREIGVFRPEIEFAGDAPIQARLLGLTGRRPSSWLLTHSAVKTRPAMQ